MPTHSLELTLSDRSGPPSLPHRWAPPRHWTARNEDRPTDAYLGEVFAAGMARPWKPYQRVIAEVAGELTPDGQYAHHTIVLTTPRQCAKTTTGYDVALGRGRKYRDYRTATRPTAARSLPSVTSTGSPSSRAGRARSWPR